MGLGFPSGGRGGGNYAGGWGTAGQSINNFLQLIPNIQEIETRAKIDDALAASGGHSGLAATRAYESGQSAVGDQLQARENQVAEQEAQRGEQARQQEVHSARMAAEQRQAAIDGATYWEDLQDDIEKTAASLPLDKQEAYIHERIANADMQEFAPFARRSDVSGPNRRNTREVVDIIAGGDKGMAALREALDDPETKDEDVATMFQIGQQVGTVLPEVAEMGMAIIAQKGGELTDAERKDLGELLDKAPPGQVEDMTEYVDKLRAGDKSGAGLWAESMMGRLAAADQASAAAAAQSESDAAWQLEERAATREDWARAEATAGRSAAAEGRAAAAFPVEQQIREADLARAQGGGDAEFAASADALKDRPPEEVAAALRGMSPSDRAGMRETLLSRGYRADPSLFGIQNDGKMTPEDSVAGARAHPLSEHARSGLARPPPADGPRGEGDGLPPAGGRADGASGSRPRTAHVSTGTGREQTRARSGPSARRRLPQPPVPAGGRSRGPSPADRAYADRSASVGLAGSDARWGRRCAAAGVAVLRIRRWRRYVVPRGG